MIGSFQRLQTLAREDGLEVGLLPLVSLSEVPRPLGMQRPTRDPVRTCLSRIIWYCTWLLPRRRKSLWVRIPRGVRRNWCQQVRKLQLLTRSHDPHRAPACWAGSIPAA